MSTANSNGLEEQREELIAKAERSERKRKKKEEKQRRKAEKRAEKKRILEEENGNEKSDDDSDIEIIEDDNGVCTVSIQPRPIKLTIKTNGHQNPSTSNSMNDSGKLTSCDFWTKHALYGTIMNPRLNPHEPMPNNLQQALNKKPNMSLTNPLRTHEQAPIESQISPELDIQVEVQTNKKTIQ